MAQQFPSKYLLREMKLFYLPKNTYTSLFITDLLIKKKTQILANWRKSGKILVYFFQWAILLSTKNVQTTKIHTCESQKPHITQKKQYMRESLIARKEEGLLQR